MANSSIYAAFERMWQHIIAKIGTKADLIHAHDEYLTEYTETDPTVPAWAKAASKPTYTASEVGAAPAEHIHDEYNPAVFEFITVENVDTICGGAPLINFTINGVAYQCPGGMTWEEFEKTEYNTDGYVKVDTDAVYCGDHKKIGISGGMFGLTLVLPEEAIVENTDYAVDESGEW